MKTKLLRTFVALLLTTLATVTAWAADTVAPTVSDKKITVVDCTKRSFTISWNKAKDNETSEDNLLYQVMYQTWYDYDYDDYIHYEVPKGQLSATITLKVKPNQHYRVKVRVSDKNHNYTDYESVSLFTDQAEPEEYPVIKYPDIELVNISYEPHYYTYSTTFHWERATDDITPKSEIDYYFYRKEISDKNYLSGEIGRNTSERAFRFFSSIYSDKNPEGHVYDLYVGARDMDGLESFYNNIIFAIPKTQGPKLPYKIAWVKSRTSNSATLEWQQATDNETAQNKLKYDIYYKPKSDVGGEYNHVFAGDGVSSCTITGLLANIEYLYCVVVTDGDGYKNCYDYAYFRTIEQQDMSRPTITNRYISVSDITHCSASLSWSRGKDDTTPQNELYYNVYIKESGASEKKLYAQGFDMTSCNINDLKESTTYYADVYVNDKAGHSTSYYTTEFKTTKKPIVGDKYPLLIEGTQVTSANANDFWGDGGTIKYDPTTKTLHLNWADLYSTSNALEIKDDITINLVGWTTISGNINAASSSKVTIKADEKYGENAQLKIQKGYFYGNCDLTIKNECTVEIDATSKGNTAGLILNSHQLSVYGSTLKVKGDGKNATITGISALSMTDCHITSDHKYDASSKTFLNASGYVAKDDIVISTEIIRVPVLVDENITIDDITHNRATVSWAPATDDNTAQSDLVYTLYTMGYGVEADYTGYKSGKNLTSCALYNLKPNTKYYVLVRVEDKDGNMTFYEETSFTTKLAPDEIAPSLTNSNINIDEVTERTISISWEKASDNKTVQSQLRYVVGYKETATPESDGYDIVANTVNINSYTFTNLNPDTFYDFYVFVIDDEENSTRYSVATASTTKVPDVTAPTLSDSKITVDAVTDCSISISWVAATDDRTPQDKLAYSVEYRKADESAWITLNAGNANIHTIDGLTEDTDYEVSIKVVDEVGNETSYGGFTITTLPTPDVTAPTLADSKIVVGAVTDSSISISWTAASDDRTAHDKLEYIVECNEAITGESKEFAVGNVKQYDITGLESNTTYFINVVVKDEAGNFNRYDATEVKTDETPDTNAPILADSKIKVDNVTENSISISWVAASDDRTDQDKLEYTVECTDVATGNKATLNIGNATSFTADLLDSGTEYLISVTVRDEANNTTRYEDVKITTSIPDAIESILATNPNVKMYNTSGVLVGKNYRGIVIINGKKYFKNK